MEVFLYGIAAGLGIGAGMVMMTVDRMVTKSISRESYFVIVVGIASLILGIATYFAN